MVCIGDEKFPAERGVVQGAVLSPMLFNVYLEEALNSSPKLSELRKRGDLLAFADDMLILTNIQAEMLEAINELEGLAPEWSLKMNKDKSQILTKDAMGPSGNTQDIGGIQCMTNVKYLGVPIDVNEKQQTDM
jgi:hypothetical protein